MGYNYFPSVVFYYTVSVSIGKINYGFLSLTVPTELGNNKAHIQNRVTWFYSV